LKLSPGRFLGIPVKTRLVSGFIFTESLYRERAVLPRHCHELAYFSLVLRGSYEEHFSRKRVRHCGLENVLYHPAGEAHSDAFGTCGGTIFSIELEPRWKHSAEAESDTPRWLKGVVEILHAEFPPTIQPDGHCSACRSTSCSFGSHVPALPPYDGRTICAEAQSRLHNECAGG
jgi:hypothetical protein